ncbi:MAG: hypothetical protein H6955_05170 [Chromatiaceae bacterium]|nr:hypothetical protein [Gammaproteobacteria bacterium]MCP5312923.1 hypothetical protein [Chromatiaceae bacterium]
MNLRILVSVALVSLLTGCGQDQPASHQASQQQKSFGGQVGDAYKGMLDEAKQGAANASQQMERTERSVRERDR